MFEDWFGDSFGSDYTPEDLGSALDSVDTSSLYSQGLDGLDLSGLLGTDTSGLDLSSLLNFDSPVLSDELTGLQTENYDSPLSYTPAQQTALDDLISKYTGTQDLASTSPVTSDLMDSWRLANPTNEMLATDPEAASQAMDNPVTRSMLVNSYLVNNPGVFGVSPDAATTQITDTYGVQNPGVYGVSPDTGGSYDNSSKQSAWNWLQSPANTGDTGSSSAQAALYKALGLTAPAAKSNLQMGLQSALAAAQIYGALKGNKTKEVTAPKLSYSSASIQNPGATSMAWNASKLKRAAGGSVPGHSAPSAKQGALGLLRGPSPGQKDDVPIDASHGEYVFDADTVAALGDGNTEAGALKLDQMRQNIRKHKRSAPPTKIPPKSKPIDSYLRGAK